MSFLRSASRAGAVVEPASSLSVVVCSGVSTSASRLDFLAIVTSIKSCERNEAIIAHLVTVLMERTTSGLPTTPLARKSRLRQTLYPQPGYRKQTTLIALLLRNAPHGPPHGRDIQNVQIRTAEHHARQVSHGKLHYAIKRTVRCESQDPSAETKRRPDIPFRIDRRPVQLPHPTPPRS